MDAAYIHMVIAAIGLVINVITLAIAGIWGLSRAEKRIIEKLDAYRDVLDGDIQALRREIGETVAAIRQKITDVELFVRDTFVRRESFFQVIKGVEAQVASMVTELKVQLQRLEDKLDRVASSRMPPAE